MVTSKHETKVPLNTIHVTDKATKMVKAFALKEGREKFGLKVGVKGGGCSGLLYVLDLADGADEEDKVIRHNDLEIYVPKKAFVFLAGTVLDFSDGLNGKGFEFTNPNAKRSCGCGNSFSV